MGLFSTGVEERCEPRTRRALANLPGEFATALQRMAASATNFRSHDAEREFAFAASGNGAPKLQFVGRENLNALSSARNRHIPLLRIGRSPNRGVAEQDMIYCLALRTVGRDGIAAKKLAIVRR